MELLKSKLGDHIQTDNWKDEKHVPVIDCSDKVESGKMFDVSVTLGKEIAHPNTTEHHIQWLALYFLPDGEKNLYTICKFDCNAHGASTKGPDEGPVHTNHSFTTKMKTTRKGTLFSMAYCNIHGLWQYSRDIELE
ncbi:MAG: desulfoferrodoxin family protein [Vulcanimicrobiota bacterium]